LGGKTLFREERFLFFILCLKNFFLSTKTCGCAQKIGGRNCPQISPSGYGPGYERNEFSHINSVITLLNAISFLALLTQSFQLLIALHILQLKFFRNDAVFHLHAYIQMRGKELPDDQHSCAGSPGSQPVSLGGSSAQICKDLGVSNKVKPS